MMSAEETRAFLKRLEEQEHAKPEEVSAWVRRALEFLTSGKRKKEQEANPKEHA